MKIDRALIVDPSKSCRAICGQLLDEVGVEFDIAADEGGMWSSIIVEQRIYDVIIIAHDTLGPDPRAFISHLRKQDSYASVPLILLVDDSVESQETEILYASGFTQIINRKQLGGLQNYIEQAQSRDTFEKNRENKVVIIEDDLAQRITVQAILEELHCECFCFASAEEALESAEDIEAHLIVADFFLEGKMTAMDMVLAVKEIHHPWRHVPIIVITGLDDTTRKYELVRSGANDYISKPIDSLDLLVRVENLLRYKHLLDTVEAQKREMQLLAMHDHLTGLYNRHFVSEQVQIGITEAQRHGVSYSMIVLDIDRFKQINDNNGHDIGDLVLKSVARFLQDNSRKNDVVARMGGEEFLILLSRCDLANAICKAERLREGLEALHPVGIEVTASFGVAELTTTINNFDKLFKMADLAVYEAKNRGRNRVESTLSIRVKTGT